MSTFQQTKPLCEKQWLKGYILLSGGTKIQTPMLAGNGFGTGSVEASKPGQFWSSYVACLLEQTLQAIGYFYLASVPWGGGNGITPVLDSLTGDLIL